MKLLFTIYLSLFVSVISLTLMAVQQHDDKPNYPKHHPLSGKNREEAEKIAAKWDKAQKDKQHLLLLWKEPFGEYVSLSLIKVDGSVCYHVFLADYENNSYIVPMLVKCP